ncbi:hypothetical protein [Verrucomicrobium spinosum]|uniref:hypothetical protein n=1 Tax=Verrucomicrobium spinosum TaxID=2736 RepID=UPI0001745363|nr:hypothetical protein [Verrucomicrobium spinosum]
MSTLQSGNDEVEEWNLGEAMAAPMFAQWKEVLDSNEKGTQRFEHIKSVILPQLPALIAAQKPNAPIAREFMDRTSIGLTMFATRVYKAEQDGVTAIAALRIARKLVISDEGVQLIEGGLAALASSDKKELCWSCGANSHLPSAREVEMYRKKAGGGNGVLDYETTTIPVPRCEPCKNKDQSSAVTLIVVPLVALVVGVFSGNTYGGGGFFLGGICGGLVGFGMFFLIAAIMDSIDQGDPEHPLVKERLDTGWLCGSPPEPEGKDT